MTSITGILVFTIIWWLVLFMVLPFGVQAQMDDPDMQEGTEPGAPIRPQLLRKFLITTGISIVLWLGLHFALINNLLS